MTFSIKLRLVILNLLQLQLLKSSFESHQRWEAGTTWKSALNNLRLLIQPFIFWCLLQSWLQVFPIPGLKRGLFKLMACMNDFRAAPITYAQLNLA